MFHLLDSDKLEADGFSPYGPSTRGEEESDPGSQAVGGAQGAGGERESVGAKGKNGQASEGGKGAGDMSREEMRRLALYAAFLLPLADSKCVNKKGANVRALVCLVVLGCAFGFSELVSYRACTYTALSSSLGGGCDGTLDLGDNTTHTVFLVGLG